MCFVGHSISVSKDELKEYTKISWFYSKDGVLFEKLEEHDDYVVLKIV